MSICFGIYLGNSSCSIAVNRDGKTSIVANAGGERVTPAIVAFNDSEVVTGVPAKQGILRHSSTTVAGALRAAGSTSLEDVLFPLNLKCQLVWEKNKPKYSVLVNEKTKQVSPEEIMRYVFTFLNDIAHSHLAEGRLPVVLTVPTWLDSSALSSVHQAASTSSFQVLATISQPAAACLAYQLLENKEDDNLVLIFHCGGTSVVASVAEISAGHLSVRESSSPSPMAGDALTEVLQKYLAKEFYNKYKGDPLESRRSARKLYIAAENCKHGLSTLSSAQIHVESLWEGVDFSMQLSRARFDGVISSTLNDFLNPVKDVLQTTGISNTQINKVILTGGSCKMPKLQQMIAEAFPQAEVLKNIPADEVLTLGAAQEAAYYMGGKKMPVQGAKPLITVLTKPIYFKILESKMDELVFPRGTPTHSRKSFDVECRDNQSSLIIFEGEKDNSKINDDQIIVQVDLNFLSPGVLNLDFTVKSDGSLLIKMTDPTKKSKTITLEADT